MERLDINIIALLSVAAAQERGAYGLTQRWKLAIEATTEDDGDCIVKSENELHTTKEMMNGKERQIRRNCGRGEEEVAEGPWEDNSWT